MRSAFSVDAPVSRSRAPALLRILILAVTVFPIGCERGARRITLATTTSVDNSGLVAVLVPAVRADGGPEVNVAAVGSGVALDLLRRGHADLAISHAPAREAELLRSGHWIYRKVMFNDFVVVGPPDDPARVAGAPTVEEAMRRIAAADARFISRGDASGTHERERELWTRAGATPRPGQLVAAGSGMGTTLRIAGTMGAYTLADRATFSQHASRGDLTIVYEGGPALVNTYSVIAPAAAPREVRRLVEWLTDGRGRQIVANYRTASGIAAFVPWPAGCPRDRPDLVPQSCF